MENEQHIINPEIKNRNEVLINELNIDYELYTMIIEIKKKFPISLVV
jgi:hypothetical protein